ncbi:lipocalin family protein [Flavobacterium dauae]|uniref:lipocalin family protein n=1 Tax=Flavobacterium dauae TaxID=1563479 RepID=UPI00101B4C20|nr:lipocalin family protein [Flavobacterium dauae]WLD23734.1 lipocalin family protein [Flavobacterium dauae]
MKKITTILFATTITLLSLTACSSDDNTPTPEPQTENHLLGMWKLNTMSLTSYENGEVVNEQTDVPVGSQITWEYEFKADNTVEYLMAIPAAEIEEQGTGTYSKNGTTLTITIDDEPGVFEITNNDADNLHLKTTEEEVEDGITYKTEIEQKFIRK